MITRRMGNDNDSSDDDDDDDDERQKRTGADNGNEDDGYNEEEADDDDEHEDDDNDDDNSDDDDDDDNHVKRSRVNTSRPAMHASCQTITVACQSKGLSGRASSNPYSTFFQPYGPISVDKEKRISFILPPPQS